MEHAGRQAMPLWRLRPGFQFARLMTYDELCDFVNMRVRKDAADAFRVKRRRPIQVQGGTITKSVTFYCNHGSAHGDEAGRKAKELLMPEETLAHRKHGVLFIPVVPALLL